MSMVGCLPARPDVGSSAAKPVGPQALVFNKITRAAKDCKGGSKILGLDRVQSEQE